MFDIEINILKFDQCALLNDKLYFFSNLDLALMEMDLKSGNTHYIGGGLTDFYPDVLMGKDGKLYAVELNGKRFVEIDVQKKTNQNWDINAGKREWNNFILVTIYKEKVYLFLNYDNSVLILDLQDSSIVEENMDFGEGVCGISACRVEKEVYINTDSGKFYRYNLDTKETELLKKVGNINSYFLQAYGEMIYCMSSDNELIKLDIKSEEQKILWKFQKNPQIIFLCATERNIWLLPSLGEKIYIYSFSDEYVFDYSNYPRDFQYKTHEGWSKYYGYTENESRYFWAMRAANYILTIDKENGTGSWFQPKGIKAQDRKKWSAEHKLEIVLEGNRTIEDILIDMYGLESEGEEKITQVGKK